jgi:hypothetical protein
MSHDKWSRDLADPIVVPSPNNHLRPNAGRVAHRHCKNWFGFYGQNRAGQGDAVEREEEYADEFYQLQNGRSKRVRVPGAVAKRTPQTVTYTVLLGMTRILLTLASISLVLLAAAVVLGLSIGDLYADPFPSAETQSWATMHRLTGLIAALAVVFVESVVVTYFIGTSRWCKEVVETYHLDRANVVDSNRLKRRTFPWALLGMLAVVGVIALGGASDPATGQPNTRAWVDWHLWGAISGIVLIGWTYVVAWNNVVANHAIIMGLVAEVARIRSERALDAPEDIPVAEPVGRWNPS